MQLQDVRLDAESPLVVTFKPNEVTFERTRFRGDGTNITFGGTAAIGAGGTQNLTVNGDLNLRVLSSAQAEPLPLGRRARGRATSAARSSRRR